MDKLLREKLDSLLQQNPKHWYITQQVDDFPTLCSCVEGLIEFQERKLLDNTLELKEYFDKKELPNFRALNNARYLGLLTNEGTYEQEKPTDTFREIKLRVGNNYKDISKYQDIIDRQIEKFHFTSEIDSNQIDNNDFDIYGIIYLYKVLLEIGTITKRFEINDNEYDFLVSTSRKYEDFYQSIYLIMQARKENDIQAEYEKIRKTKKLKEDGTESANKNFDDRTKHLIRQNSYLQYENGTISIKKEHIPIIFQKVKSFENNPKTINNYVQFLCSTDSLIEDKKEDDMSDNKTYEGDSYNRIIFGAPGTGKSHKLEEESKLFTTQETIQETTEEIIKKELMKAPAQRKCAYQCAMGFKYSKQLKDKTGTELKDLFDLKNNSEMAVGVKARPFYDELDEPKSEDNTIDDKIKDLIKEAQSSDNMLAYLYAIGFKYSEFITDCTRNELITKYKLGNGSQAYYLDMGIIGAPLITLEEEQKETIKYLERVTFHPNYSYAQFVGTYKPVQNSENEDQINYEYVPGPFMRVYTNALNHKDKKFLLLIEEINRANVAAVFGDVFQLLDRKSDGNSEYPITISEDVKKYLARNGINSSELSIPSNMYIWATMNSADQGVLPMDAAFKRRWDFEYLGIDDGEYKEDGTIDANFESYTLPIPCVYDNNSKKVTKYNSLHWNLIRHAINYKLKEISGVNEDKLLGPYFLSKTVLESATKAASFEEQEKYCSLFKSKVLMYLFEDVVKMNPTELFNSFDQNKPLHYSDLCSKFDEIGLDIFNEEFVKE